MNDLLNSSGFKWNAEIALKATMATGLEHGFFIWAQPGAAGQDFYFSKIYTGESSNMGTPFALAAIQHWFGDLTTGQAPDPFWGTYHAHPGEGEESRYPSCCAMFGSDMGFNRYYHAIGIIGSRWDVVSSYGR
jgi:hypothetical protein